MMTPFGNTVPGAPPVGSSDLFGPLVCMVYFQNRTSESRSVTCCDWREDLPYRRHPASHRMLVGSMARATALDYRPKTL